MNRDIQALGLQAEIDRLKAERDHFDAALTAAFKTMDRDREALQDALRSLELARAKLPYKSLYDNAAARIDGSIHTIRQALKGEDG